MSTKLPESMASVDAVIEKLREEYECRTDRELALALRIDPTSISAWRRRGRVPAKYMLRVRAKRDLFAATDKIIGSFYALRAAYIHALIAIAAKNISDRTWYLDLEYSEIRLGFALAKLHTFLDSEFRNKVKGNLNDEARALFDDLKSKLGGDEIVDVIEGLPDSFV